MSIRRPSRPTASRSHSAGTERTKTISTCTSSWWGPRPVRRLTTHPDFDADPSWSPDGKQIAFIRWRMAGGCRVYVLSLLGGSEQKLGEFAVSEADPARYSSIAWSPDANYVAAAGTPLPQPGTRAVPGIYLLPVTRGVPRLLAPAERGMVHYSPAFSRDARHLAYVSCKGQRLVRRLRHRS